MLSILALLALTVSGSVAPSWAAQQTTGFVPQVAPATQIAPPPSVEKLRHVEYFAMGGVGFAGRISAGETAYRSLLNYKDAVAHFENLIKTAEPAGQLYALIGLRELKAPSYARIAKNLRSRTDVPVDTMSGCLMAHETLGVVATRLTGDPTVKPVVKPSVRKSPNSKT